MMQNKSHKKNNIQQVFDFWQIEISFGNIHYKFQQQHEKSQQASQSRSQAQKINGFYYVILTLRTRVPSQWKIQTAENQRKSLFCYVFTALRSPNKLSLLAPQTIMYIIILFTDSFIAFSTLQANECVEICWQLWSLRKLPLSAW